MESFCVAHDAFGNDLEGVLRRRLAIQQPFRLFIAPRFVRDTAKRNSCFLDQAIRHFKCSGDGDQSKGIRLSVAQFQVSVMVGESLRGQIDGSDDLVSTQVAVNLGLVAWQTMEVCEWDGAGATRARDVDDCFQSGECDTHVGWMNRNALIAGTENRMHPVEALDCRAACAGFAFITRCRYIVEVVAARPL